MHVACMLCVLHDCACYVSMFMCVCVLILVCVLLYVHTYKHLSNIHSLSLAL